MSNFDLNASLIAPNGCVVIQRDCRWLTRNRVFGARRTKFSTKLVICV